MPSDEKYLLSGELWRTPTQRPRPLTYNDGLMECDGCDRLTPEHVSYRFPKGPDDKYGDAYLCEECAEKRMAGV